MPSAEPSPPGQRSGTAPATAGADGRSTRWTGQSARRRESFVDAALAAIAEHGPEASVEQIAARAGVARTRVYRHFDGATDLNRAIAVRVEEMVLANFAPVWDPGASPEEIIRGAVSAHLSWMTDHHQVYRYLTRHAVLSGSGETVVNDVKHLIAGVITELLDSVGVVLGLDARITAPLAHGLVGFVDGAADRWVTDPNGVSLSEIVGLLSDGIWASLAGVLVDAGVELDPTASLSSVLSPLGEVVDGPVQGP